MIPQSFIQDLLARVDIVDVVGKYVQLKRVAQTMGLCPFITKKSPVLQSVRPNSFITALAGAHGTSIGFLMEYSGMSFVDAVKDLALNNGMVVP